MLLRLSLCLGGAWRLYGCAADQCFILSYVYLCVIVCVCVSVCVLNTDLMHATPTREFLLGFDRGGMSPRTNIYAHKQTLDTEGFSGIWSTKLDLLCYYDLNLI